MINIQTKEQIEQNKVLRNLKQLYELRIRGLSDGRIAQALGITKQALMKAIESNEEIKSVYEDATMLLCAELRAVVIDRALGRDGNPPDASLAFKVLTHIDADFKKATETSNNITIEHIIRQLNSNPIATQNNGIDSPKEE